MPRRALSATRAADVLNFLAAHPDESFSYSQIAQRLGINLASTHNLLIALNECGYLKRGPNDRRFSLGPALVAIGDAALRGHRAIEETRRAMRELSREQGTETLAFVRAGTDAFCVARAGPSAGPGRTVQVGQRIPMMAPLSSVFFAWAAEDEIERWLLRGGAPRREQKRQREILRQVRERGYSVALEVAGRRQLGDLLVALAENPRSESLPREMREIIHELGLGPYQLAEESRAPLRISTLTAPIFDAHGQVDLSLTLQVFRDDLTPSGLRTLGQSLLATVDSIARASAAASGEG